MSVAQPESEMCDQIVAVGVDIIEISRVVAFAARGTTYLRRVFTQQELELADGRSDWEQFLAGRFAAKEAIAKCIGPPLGWHDVEVLSSSDSSPDIRLYGRAAAKVRESQVLVSISHCRDYAMAFAVLKSANRGRAND